MRTFNGLQGKCESSKLYAHMKFILLVLTLCIILFALPGCSDGSEPGDKPSDQAPVTEADPTPAEETQSTPEPTAEVKPEPTADVSPEPTEEVSSEPIEVFSYDPTNDVYTIHGKKYTMTFFDDFDGDKLDNSKWERCPEWQRQDLKIPWKNEASYLDGEGNLVLAVMEDEKTEYKTGAVRTNGRFTQAYGYFEIRAKLQQSEGFWTAFWLMGDSVVNVGNGSADGAEIDIFEALYKEKPRIHHAIHWDGYGEDHKGIGHTYFAPGDIYDGYHTFALEWSKDAYTFYVDDVKTWTTTADGICDQPLYMKVSAEVGTWGGDMKNAKLPDFMLVDYVKAYQFVEGEE